MRMASKIAPLNLTANQLMQLTLAGQEDVLAQLRVLSMDDIERLFIDVVATEIYIGPLPEANNELRRQQRHADYIRQLRAIAGAYLASLDPAYPAVDIGCGDGEIARAVFDEFMIRGGELAGCDVVNYLTPRARNLIVFEQTDGASYMSEIADNHFGCVLEVVALHHLPTREEYRHYVAQMIRVTRPGGLVIFVETIHTNWIEHFTNAVLDILLNDRTSRHLTGCAQRAIPVPVQFLSETELTAHIQAHGATILQRVPMEPTRYDPKRHVVYICQANR